MRKYQNRVVEEKEQLDKNLEELVAFINSPEFCSVDPVEQRSLRVQRRLMQQYSDILGKRIAAFSAEPEETNDPAEPEETNGEPEETNDPGEPKLFSAEENSDTECCGDQVDPKED